MPQEIQLFADKQIRTYWDDDKELYFFCIIDVVEALTDSNDPKQYIKRMRQRDPGLNSVWGTICTPHQFLSSMQELDEYVIILQINALRENSYHFCPPIARQISWAI